jgi:hypothetical protein
MVRLDRDIGFPKHFPTGLLRLMVLSSRTMTRSRPFTFNRDLIWRPEGRAQG